MWKEYTWFFKVCLCGNKSFARSMLRFWVLAKSTEEQKVYIFCRIYNQKKEHTSLPDKDWRPFPPSKVFISLWKWNFFSHTCISFIFSHQNHTEIQFLQVLWGNQCSICTLGILPGKCNMAWHSRTELFKNSLARSGRMKIRNLILPHFNPNQPLSCHRIQVSVSQIRM